MGMGLLAHCILILSVVQLQMKGYEGCLEMERRGLLQIKSFFVSHGRQDTQSELASWVDNKASNCCLWKRVKCNNSTNHVTELDLHHLSNLELDTLMLNTSLLRPFRELLSLNLSQNYFQGWTDNGEGNACTIFSIIIIRMFFTLFKDLKYNYSSVVM